MPFASGAAHPNYPMNKLTVWPQPNVFIGGIHLLGGTFLPPVKDGFKASMRLCLQIVNRCLCWGLHWG